MTGREAAIKVLEDAGGTLPLKDVTRGAAALAQLSGKTPEATIAGQIYTLAKKGKDFRIVERGVVGLLEPQTKDGTDGDEGYVDVESVDDTRAQEDAEAVPF